MSELYKIFLEESEEENKKIINLQEKKKNIKKDKNLIEKYQKNH